MIEGQPSEYLSEAEYWSMWIDRCLPPVCPLSADVEDLVDCVISYGHSGSQQAWLEWFPSPLIQLPLG